MYHYDRILCLRRNDICNSFIRVLVRAFSTHARRDNHNFAGGENISDAGEKLLECYKILNLPQTCSKEELKSRYLELAKRYHPDTGGATANTDAFRRCHSAYKFIVDNDYSVTDRRELEDLPKVYDIRHTAPQHRQYLEYGGVGHGTPSERQRQYQQYRVQKASENVSEFIMRRLQANDMDFALITKTAEEAEYARKWKTRNAIDRMVEDLIQESMKKGEFDKLSGAGKPLPYDSHNPYVDSMTHKLNQVLIQNGFCPEWVLLEKEIRQDVKRIRDELSGAKQKATAAGPGDWHERQRAWDNTVQKLRDDASALNKRIDHFNLLVPSLHKQMVHLVLNKEITKLEKAEQKLPDNKQNFIEKKADKDETGENNQVQQQEQSIFRMLLNALTLKK